MKIFSDKNPGPLLLAAGLPQSPPEWGKCQRSQTPLYIRTENEMKLCILFGLHSPNRQLSKSTDQQQQQHIRRPQLMASKKSRCSVQAPALSVRSFSGIQLWAQISPKCICQTLGQLVIFFNKI